MQLSELLSPVNTHYAMAIRMLNHAVIDFKGLWQSARQRRKHIKATQRESRSVLSIQPPSTVQGWAAGISERNHLKNSSISCAASAQQAPRKKYGPGQSVARVSGRGEELRLQTDNADHGFLRRLLFPFRQPIKLGLPTCKHTQTLGRLDPAQ